jgi:hypothetical protein
VPLICHKGIGLQLQDVLEGSDSDTAQRDIWKLISCVPWIIEDMNKRKKRPFIFLYKGFIMPLQVHAIQSADAEIAAREHHARQT